MARTRRGAIIGVDLLEGFYRIGNLASPRVAKIIPHVRALLKEKTEKEGWLTIFLADRHKPDDPEFKMFPKHCVEGTKEADVISELAEFLHLPNVVVVPKATYSGFFSTNLEDLLREENPKLPIVVVGVCTDICVLHTVADLRCRQYQVVVPADCVETFDAPWHRARSENAWALRHMDKILGARVTRSAKLI